MKGGPRNRTADYLKAEKAADAWIGQYTWAQQAAIPTNMDRILRAMWIHGYMAALTASEPQESAND